MASMRVCIFCRGRYRRSKNRHFGQSFCSDRCRWSARDIPIQLIYERDDAVCHLCFQHVERSEASRDHVKPKSLGGKLSWENLKLAHSSCNSKRGSQSVPAFRAKLEAMLNSRATA